MNKERLGWIVAAAMAGALVMSGFQGASMKLANVDVEKVFNASSLTKENTDQLRAYGSKRAEVIDFLSHHPFIVPSDAQTYVDLALKEKPSDADTQKIQSITKQADSDGQRYNGLIQKKPPTDEDNKEIAALHSEGVVNQAFAQKIGQQFDKEFQQQQTKLKEDALDKVRKTISEVARKQGYSIVFDVSSAPFAANNLTEEVTKEINKS